MENFENIKYKDDADFLVWMFLRDQSAAIFNDIFNTHSSQNIPAEEKNKKVMILRTKYQRYFNLAVEYIQKVHKKIFIKRFLESTDWVLNYNDHYLKAKCREWSENVGMEVSYSELKSKVDDYLANEQI